MTSHWARTFHEERHDDLESVLLRSENERRQLVGKLVIVREAADDVRLVAVLLDVAADLAVQRVLCKHMCSHPLVTSQQE